MLPFAGPVGMGVGFVLGKIFKDQIPETFCHFSIDCQFFQEIRGCTLQKAVIVYNRQNDPFFMTIVLSDVYLTYCFVQLL